jgi:hypothetical protein
LDHKVQDDLNIDVGGEDTAGGQESNRLRFVHSLGIAVQSLYCADVTESLAYVALVRRVAAFLQRLWRLAPESAAVVRRPTDIDCSRPKSAIGIMAIASPSANYQQKEMVPEGS